MNIGQFSDLHYCEENLEEADRCFGFAVEDAIARKIQVGILSGDSTDHILSAHSPALLALMKRIKQLADHCPVFILQGTFSHEPVGMLDVFSLIGAKYPIHVSKHIEMVALKDNKWFEYDPVHDDSASLDLVITSLPTVNKAELVTTMDISRASEEMGNHLAIALASFGPTNDRLHSNGIPTVLVSHGTVDGSLNENGVPMAGLDHEFSLGALYAAKTDAVMLGHIHKHQTWERTFQNRRQLIAYAGSIGCFHYGEEGNKHYLTWHIDEEVSLDAIPTPSRRTIDVSFDGAPDIAELTRVAEQFKGAYIRVRYAVDEEYAKTIDRAALKEILMNAGASGIKIEGTVLTVQRQRCPGISLLKTVGERLMKWAELTGTAKEGLLERLNKLESESAETIAGRLVRKAPANSTPKNEESTEQVDFFA